MLKQRHIGKYTMLQCTNDIKRPDPKINDEQHLTIKPLKSLSSKYIKQNELVIALGIRSGGGNGAGVLVQVVTHAFQTSLVTSRPARARQNYKTGRAAQPTAPTRGAGGSAVADAPPADPNAPPAFHIPWAASRRCSRRGRAGTRARGERRYGARAQVL